MSRIIVLLAGRLNILPGCATRTLGGLVVLLALLGFPVQPMRALAANDLAIYADSLCAARYEVQVRQGSTGGAIVDNPTSMSLSRYTTNTLSAGKTLYLRVRGCDRRAAARGVIFGALG